MGSRLDMGPTLDLIFRLRSDDLFSQWFDTMYIRNIFTEIFYHSTNTKLLQNEGFMVVHYHTVWSLFNMHT